MCFGSLEIRSPFSTFSNANPARSSRALKQQMPLSCSTIAFPLRAPRVIPCSLVPVSREFPLHREASPHTQPAGWAPVPYEFLKLVSSEESFWHEFRVSFWGTFFHLSSNHSGFPIFGASLSSKRERCVPGNKETPSAESGLRLCLY